MYIFNKSDFKIVIFIGIQLKMIFEYFPPLETMVRMFTNESKFYIMKQL